MINGSKNKGDWGEFYALVYLLGIQRLYASDVSLNKLENYYFPILKVFRDERISSHAKKHIDYVIDNDTRVEIFENDILLGSISAQELLDEAERLREDIPNGEGSQFTIPHGEELLNRLGLTRLSAPSEDITDIQMEVHDTHVGIDQNVGFSVKSYLGGAPTLLNASGATNFVFAIKNLNKAQADEINAIDTRTKIKDRIDRIYQNGGSLEYIKPASSIFAENLMMIDSNMDRILAEMLLYFYESSVKKCSEVVEHIEQSNPLNYPRQGIYSYKFKEFLCAKALGLDPGRLWNGMDDANGGYIVVKEDGDVVAFHIYDRDIFKQYLLDNTHFEKGSTSKHNYATIYEDNGAMYINLNLQIRFLSR